MYKSICLDTSGLLKSDHIQKNINLENLLLNHSQYVSMGDKIKANLQPLRFAYSIRSCYSNKVIVHNFSNDEEVCYTPYDILSNVGRTPHRGYDLVMFIGSIAIRNAIDESKCDLNGIMLQSNFEVIGLYYNKGIDNDPIIYSQIILKDNAFNDIEKALKSDYSIKNIADIDAENKRIYKALADTLTIL